MSAAASSSMNRKGMTMTDATLTRYHAQAISDRQEYRLLFAATFGIFLVAALIMRIVRSIAGSRPSVNPGSLLAEAKSTGYSALAFAFGG